MTKINLKTKFIALTAMLVVLTLGIIVINVFIAVKKSNFENFVSFYHNYIIRTALLILKTIRKANCQLFTMSCMYLSIDNKGGGIYGCVRGCASDSIGQLGVSISSWFISS